MSGIYRFALLVSSWLIALNLGGCQPALPNSATKAEPSAAKTSSDQTSNQTASGLGEPADKLPPGGIQALPNGTHYQFCSTPPSATGEPPMSGYCYVFRKTGDRLFGYYYDTATSGAEGLCISGLVQGNTVTGKGIERVGGMGRQEIPPGADGTQPVNWDSDGFLQVANAKVLDESILDGTQVKYATVRLQLDPFQRHPDTENPVPESCDQ